MSQEQQPSGIIDLEARARSMHSAPITEVQQKSPLVKTKKMVLAEKKYGGTPIENLLYDDDIDIGKTTADRAASLGVRSRTLTRWMGKISAPKPKPVEEKQAPVLPLDLHHLVQKPTTEIVGSQEREHQAADEYRKTRKQAYDVGFSEAISRLFGRKSPYQSKLEAAGRRYERMRKERVIRENSHDILEHPTDDLIKNTNHIQAYRHTLVRKVVSKLGLVNAQQEAITQKATEALAVLPREAKLRDIIETLTPILPDDPKNMEKDEDRIATAKRKRGEAIRSMGLLVIALIGTLAVSRLHFSQEVHTPTPSAQVTMTPGVEYPLKDNFSYSTWTFNSLDTEGNLPSIKGAFERILGEERYGIKGPNGTFDPFNPDQREKFDESIAADPDAKVIQTAYITAVLAANPASSFADPKARFDDLQVRLGTVIFAPSLEQVAARVGASKPQS